MSSTCIEKIIHEECGKETLQVFANDDGTVTGFCFNPDCNMFVADPYNGEYDEDELVRRKADARNKGRGEVDRISLIRGDPGTHRSLRSSSLARYGIKREGQTWYFPAHNIEGDITGYKCKIEIEGQKNIWWSVGEVADAVPFGWHQALGS
jgi:hypothetical protein